MSHPLPTAVIQGSLYANAYPFAQPGDDVRGLLTDFYLAYPDDAGDFTLPFRVDWLFGFGTDPAMAPPGTPTPTHARDLRVLDAADAVVFDSTLADAYHERAWGDRLVLAWEGTQAVCRAVRQAVDPADWPTHLAPAAGVLDGRTYERLPRRLRSLRVSGGDAYAGAVRLEGGYNVALAAAPAARRDGGRLVRRVTVDATPGGGAGRAPGCTDDAEVLVRRVNGVGPGPAGDFYFDADSCYRWQAPVTVDPASGGRLASYGGLGLEAAEAMAALAASGDCQPCCPCDYYVRVYRGLSRVWDMWASAAAEAEDLRDTYAAARLRWLAERDCRVANPLRLTAAAEGGCGVRLGGLYVNVQDCVLTDVELRFTHRLFAGADPAAPAGSAHAAVIQGPQTGGAAPYTMGGAWPIFKAHFPRLPAQALASIAYRLRVAACAAGMAVETTLTAHAAAPDDCALPEADVPAAVSAVWVEAGDVPARPALALAQATTPLDPARRSFGC